MLELRDVVGGYGDTTVLREISLTVPDGSVVALLGPNGAGKTTTLRIASGLLRPRSGSVLLDGQDIARLSPYRRAALRSFGKQPPCHELPEGAADLTGRPCPPPIARSGLGGGQTPRFQPRILIAKVVRGSDPSLLT